MSLAAHPEHEEFLTKFAEGYSSERGDEFWPPGVGIGTKELLINHAVKRIKQTSNKQSCVTRINFVCLFASDKLKRPAEVYRHLSWSNPCQGGHPMARAKSLFHSANHAINYCARSIAKNAVKEQMRAQGRRMTLVPVREINEKAEQYLGQHPELYRQALERAKRMRWVGQVEPLVTPMEWLTDRIS